MSEFKSITKEVCKLPSFFSTTLFKKIDNGTGVVTRCVIYFFLELVNFFVSWIVILV